MKRYLLWLTAYLALTSLICPPSWASKEHHEGHEHHDEHEHRPEHREEREYHDRRFYESRRVSDVRAREIVTDSFSQWQVGEGWQKSDKHGGIELIIPLEYQGKIIGEVKVNPSTGNIMPEKAKPIRQQPNFSVAQARQIVQQALPKMVIGDSIRLGKHSNYWEIPLMLQKMEVEEIKVGTGTGRILPDWHVEEEAYHYRHR